MSSEPGSYRDPVFVYMVQNVRYQYESYRYEFVPTNISYIHSSSRTPYRIFYSSPPPISFFTQVLKFFSLASLLPAPILCFLLTPKPPKNCPFIFLLYLMPDDFTLYTQDNFTCRITPDYFTPWGLMTGSYAIQLLGKLHIDITSKIVAFYHKVFLLYPKLY